MTEFLLMVSFFAGLVSGYILAREDLFGRRE